MKKKFYFNLSYLLLLTVFILMGCEKEKNANPTYNVFHSLTYDGINYGFSENINSPTNLRWRSFLSNSTNVLTIVIPYKKPGTSEIYDSFIIMIENPRLGTNDANITYIGGCYSINGESTFRVNLTKLASGPGDYYEGTFSGNILVWDLCVTRSTSPSCSGSFKVYFQ